MDPKSLLGMAAAIVVKDLAHRATQALRNYLEAESKAPRWDEAAVGNHLNWVCSWSETIQIKDMTQPESVDETTIPMRFSTGSGYRRITEHDDVISETSLLGDEHTYFILGDPGSGKTTVIKRLCRLLFRESNSAQEHWQYPVVVLLRDLGPKESLVHRLATNLGILYDIPSDLEPSMVSHTVHPTTKERLVEAVARALDSSGGVVLVDGLDELIPSHRQKVVEPELQTLIHLLKRSKLIVSARSSSSDRVFENIHIVEVLPLTSDQIRAVAQWWLKDEATHFLGSLGRVPYHELGGRPLFLVRLIVIFKRTRTLPPQPYEVYERVIRLVLEDWDAERDVTRMSRYANFGSEQKLRFLAALAHHLLWQLKGVRFDRFTLERAYVAVCPQFSLPDTQAEAVVREICSHTGLISVPHSGVFEFSHLSLQEYLCAYYIVRNPLPQRFSSYLSSYPAPLAIATTMSSDPGDFLALLILSGPNFRMPAESLSAFLSRLMSERPRFQESIAFGLTMLQVISEHLSQDPRPLTYFATNCDPSILFKSIVAGLRSYGVVYGRREGYLQFVKQSQAGLLPPLIEPEKLSLPDSFVADIIDNNGGRLIVQSDTGAMIQLSTKSGEVVLTSLAKEIKSKRIDAKGSDDE
jgi:hypothetical protein